MDKGHESSYAHLNGYLEEYSIDYIQVNRVNDVMEGSAVIYFQVPHNGERMECEYINNKKNGKAILYDKNGICTLNSSFVNDVIEGECKIYEDGKLSFNGTMSNNHINGYGYKRSKGILIYEGYYKDSKRNGIGREYDTDGSVLSDCVYKDGKKLNAAITYDDNEDCIMYLYDDQDNVTLLGIIDPKTGILNGLGCRFHSDGTVSDVVRFSNDSVLIVLIRFFGDEMTEYDKNGDVVYKGGYRMISDLVYHRDGEGIEYNGDQEIVYRGQFSDGVRCGHGKEFQKGVCIYEGCWENNQRNGEGCSFLESGGIEKKGMWKNNKCVEVTTTSPKEEVKKTVSEEVPAYPIDSSSPNMDGMDHTPSGVVPSSPYGALPYGVVPAPIPEPGPAPYGVIPIPGPPPTPVPSYGIVSESVPTPYGVIPDPSAAPYGMVPEHLPGYGMIPHSVTPPFGMIPNHLSQSYGMMPGQSSVPAMNVPGVLSHSSPYDYIGNTTSAISNDSGLYHSSMPANSFQGTQPSPIPFTQSQVYSAVQPPQSDEAYESLYNAVVIDKNLYKRETARKQNDNNSEEFETDSEKTEEFETETEKTEEFETETEKTEEFETETEKTEEFETEEFETDTETQTEEYESESEKAEESEGDEFDTETEGSSENDTEDETQSEATEVTPEATDYDTDDSEAFSEEDEEVPSPPRRTSPLIKPPPAIKGPPTPLVAAPPPPIPAPAPPVLAPVPSQLLPPTSVPDDFLEKAFLQSVPKPPEKTAEKPAPKQAPRPVNKPVPKPVEKVEEKVAPKPAPKPAPRPADKPIPKPIPKPTPKPTAKSDEKQMGNPLSKSMPPAPPKSAKPSLFKSTSLTKPSVGPKPSQLKKPLFTKQSVDSYTTSDNDSEWNFSDSDSGSSSSDDDVNRFFDSQSSYSYSESSSPREDVDHTEKKLPALPPLSARQRSTSEISVKSTGSSKEQKQLPSLPPTKSQGKPPPPPPKPAKSVFHSLGGLSLSNKTLLLDDQFFGAVEHMITVDEMERYFSFFKDLRTRSNYLTFNEVYSFYKQINRGKPVCFVMYVHV